MLVNSSPNYNQCVKDYCYIALLDYDNRRNIVAVKLEFPQSTSTISVEVSIKAVSSELLGAAFSATSLGKRSDIPRPRRPTAPRRKNRD